MQRSKYGLIGEKLGHSFSKIIHEQLGKYDYQLMPIPPEEIDSFMKKRDFKGLNVTIPYKKTVLPYCDILTDSAKKIGCVNTLVMQPDGKLLGDNTDYFGFLNLADSVGIDFSGKKVLVLGSGGTSLTVSVAAKDRGALWVQTVSRSGKINYQNIYEQADADIIINTTPMGMFPHNGEKLLELSRFKNLCGVLDVIYNPLSTALLQEAKSLNIPCGCGLRMLVAQAKFAAERFAGAQIDDAKIDKIETELKKQLTNLVLIGMPGSGKSALSKLCAKALSREICETDELVEQNAGMSIPDIFAKHGEDAFRDIESAVIKKAGCQTGRIISTGGGIIKRAENIAAMRQNAVVVWIKRPLKALCCNGRPLSENAEAVEKLWQQRRELYSTAADYSVENSGDINDTLKLILEGYYEALGDKRS